MKDKVCIVTGANTGIGKATAEGLARKGATVVVACRDEAKGKAAEEELRAKAGSKDVHFLKLDLASLRSVREFAAAFTARFPRLDVLVENAGVSTGKRQVTADGLEMNLGVNHVGHALLAELLLPSLKASAPSRVVVLSSSMAKGAKLDFADLQGEKSWSMTGSYASSKLANLLFVHSLAKRLEGTKVVVNAVHPGVIASELARDFPAPLRWMAKLFFKSTEQGARTSLHVATSSDAATVSGKYFADSKVADAGPSAHDDALAERLWTETERLIAAASAPAPAPKAEAAASAG